MSNHQGREKPTDDRDYAEGFGEGEQPDPREPVPGSDEQIEEEELDEDEEDESPVGEPSPEENGDPGSFPRE